VRETKHHYKLHSSHTCYNSFTCTN